MEFLRRLFKRKDAQVKTKEQNILLLITHQYFMDLPHSYFLRKGPK